MCVCVCVYLLSFFLFLSLSLSFSLFLSFSLRVLPSGYMGSPCHVEMVLSVKEDGVRKHVSLGKKEKGVSKRAQNAARKEQSLVSSSQA